MTGKVLSDGFKRNIPQHLLAWVFLVSSELLSVNFSMILAYLSKLKSTGSTTNRRHRCVLNNRYAEIMFYYCY